MAAEEVGPSGEEENISEETIAITRGCINTTLMYAMDGDAQSHP